MERCQRKWEQAGPSKYNLGVVLPVSPYFYSDVTLSSAGEGAPARRVPQAAAGGCAENVGRVKHTSAVFPNSSNILSEKSSNAKFTLFTLFQLYTL